MCKSLVFSSCFLSWSLVMRNCAISHNWFETLIFDFPQMSTAGNRMLLNGMVYLNGWLKAWKVRIQNSSRLYKNNLTAFVQCGCLTVPSPFLLASLSGNGGFFWMQTPSRGHFCHTARAAKSNGTMRWEAFCVYVPLLVKKNNMEMNF